MISVLFTSLSIIDHLLINICMTIPPQHYEITFLEEWNSNYHEQILIVNSEFQTGWNSAHSQDKLNWKKKKTKEGKKNQVKVKNMTGEDWEKY